jgi:hypothetical protein
MGQLAPRQEKKRQMVRLGYGGVGIGALLLLVAILSTSIPLAIVGLIVLAVAGWATRLLRQV